MSAKMKSYNVLFGFAILIMAYLAVANVAYAKTGKSAEFAQADTPAEVREAVEEVFGANSIMVQIARCESTFRQFDEDGSVLQGKADPRDTGVMQINTHYHERDALALGFDIRTLKGNLAYAKYLKKHQGTTPWNNSKHCWG